MLWKNSILQMKIKLQIHQHSESARPYERKAKTIQVFRLKTSCFLKNKNCTSTTLKINK